MTSKLTFCDLKKRNLEYVRSTPYRPLERTLLLGRTVCTVLLGNIQCKEYGAKELQYFSPWILILPFDLSEFNKMTGYFRRCIRYVDAIIPMTARSVFAFFQLTFSAKMQPKVNCAILSDLKGPFIDKLIQSSPKWPKIHAKMTHNKQAMAKNDKQ